MCDSHSSHVWLWNTMDYSPPGSSVHGIFQVRILDWVAILFSRGSSQPRDWTLVSHIEDKYFTISAIYHPIYFLMPEIHRALSLIRVSANHWRLDKHLSFSGWQNHKTARNLPNSFGLSTLGISHQKEVYPPVSKSSFKHCVIIMYYQDTEWWEVDHRISDRPR